MIAGENLRAAVRGRGWIDRDRYGNETLRETRPGDIILMQIVTFGSGRFQNDLVFEQMRGFAIDSAEDIE